MPESVVRVVAVVCVDEFKHGQVDCGEVRMFAHDHWVGRKLTECMVGVPVAFRTVFRVE